MPTQIPGKRIKPGTILLSHFGDFKIPESRLTLNYASHPHSNKVILDRLRYTGTTDIIDLGLFETGLLEIVSARRDGLNLGGTIDTKADKAFVQELVAEIETARGDNESLYDAIRSNASMIEEKINNHIGTISHQSLDNLYADYIAAKQGYSSLLEAMQAISAIDPNSPVVVNQFRPWTIEYIVTTPGQRVFLVPQTYGTNANAIEVFEGPLRMMVNDDYIEKDEESIEFLYDLSVGSRVRITGVHDGSLYDWTQYFVSSANQRTFNLVNSYETNRDQIVVYESGMLMRKGHDYIETNSNTITFTDNLPEGVKVAILKRR